MEKQIKIKTIIRQEYCFINVKGAIRELRFIGNEISRHPCGGFTNHLLFEDGEGNEYKIDPALAHIYDDLESAKKCGLCNLSVLHVDCNDLIIENGGRILFDGWQYVSWVWNEKENQAVEYSVGRGWKEGNIDYIRILKGSVEYCTYNGEKINPNPERYFPTKKECMKANATKVILFNKDGGKEGVDEKVNITISKNELEKLKSLAIKVEFI